MSTCVFIPGPCYDAVLIAEAVKELGYLFYEIKKIRDECGNEIDVDSVIENGLGQKIGIRQNAQQQTEFVVLDGKNPAALQSLNRIKQALARTSVLNQAKSKGYNKIKEEKLPNGSIRLVVQKWR